MVLKFLFHWVNWEVIKIGFDYKKLTKDLIEAKEKALESVAGDDGGSANLDCLTISLPRLREEKVIEAIEKSGLRTSGKHNWIGQRYFIYSPHGSQGNDNTNQIEAMYEYLKAKGYDVLIFYQLD